MGERDHATEPVTVVFTWDVTPGRESSFEEWAHGINTEAAGFPGHLGATWLRAEGMRHRYYTVLTFADEDRLSDWLESPERKVWLDDLNGIATAHRHHPTTGLETWFSLPGEAVPAPPRWKMALVTFCAVYPLSLLFQAFLTPVTDPLPMPVRALTFPVIVVPLLTYALMPFLSRVLRRYLYPVKRRHRPARPDAPDED